LLKGVRVGAAQELEFGLGAGDFDSLRVPSASALGCGSSEDDEQDADDVDERRCLMQDEESEENCDGGFKGHQRPERRSRHAAQGEELERECTRPSSVQRVKVAR
jgi:hypothetical protein